MGLMDKFKNLFTEEVEEVKPIKKEVRHVEIKAPKKEPEEMPKKEENTISDSTTIKKEEKFVFPVYFDDKDFDDLEKPKEKIIFISVIIRTELYERYRDDLSKSRQIKIAKNVIDTYITRKGINKEDTRLDRIEVFIYRGRYKLIHIKKIE